MKLPVAGFVLGLLLAGGALLALVVMGMALIAFGVAADELLQGLAWALT